MPIFLALMDSISLGSTAATATDKITAKSTKEKLRIILAKCIIFIGGDAFFDIHPIATLSHRKRFDSLSQGIPTSGAAKVARAYGTVDASQEAATLTVV